MSGCGEPCAPRVAGGAVPGNGRHLSDALKGFAETFSGDRVDLASIARFMGQGSIGALLLILALPMVLPIPAPGISVLFGIPMILVSAQLMAGRRYAWLPARLARRSIARADLIDWIDRGLPVLRSFETVVRPKFAWMAGDWAMIPIGAVCLLMALIITLPIPFGHMIPGTVIVLLSLGLIERDGIVIGLGLIAAILALAVVTLASTGLVLVIRNLRGT